MISVLVWVLSVISNLFLARKKDRSLVGWGFLGVVIPVFSTIILLFLSKKSEKTQDIPIKRSGIQSCAFVIINIFRIFCAGFLPLIIAFQLSNVVLKKNVDGGDIPTSFPIAIVTPAGKGHGEQVNIIEKRDLDNFLEKHSDYSYLMPDSSGEHVLSQIPNESGYWFRVESKEGTRQSLVVSSSPYNADGKNIGWYDATNKQIFPKYHLRYFEPAIFIGPFGIAILLSMYLIWQLFGFLLRKLRLA